MLQAQLESSSHIVLIHTREYGPRTFYLKERPERPGAVALPRGRYLQQEAGISGDLRLEASDTQKQRCAGINLLFQGY